MRMAGSRQLRSVLFLASAASLALGLGEAFAHTSERGHVLLLPTQYYRYGGALAVVLTFLVLVAVPAGALERAACRRLKIAPKAPPLRAVFSLVSFSATACLVAAGVLGSRDPLSNPLPLVVWTLLWVGVTVLQGVFGNLWAWINPWYGPWRLVTAACGTGRARAPFRLPARIGVWPAVVLLVLFIWFELIDPAPDDPDRLAVAVGAYWLFTFAGMLAFGYRPWTRQVEFLSVFFGLVARLSLFDARRSGTMRRGIAACLPAAKLVEEAPLPPSGVAFLLAALGSVSFDGFMRTFAWLGAIGVNPLEFPGRTAVMLPDTIGLVGMIACLGAAFVAAVAVGETLAGGRRFTSGTGGLAASAGLLIWSIVPIAMAYHVAHYIVVFMVDGQYALAAISDPLSNGWNLFGTAGYHVSAGVVLGAGAAWVIWNIQAAVIIGGHVLAVVIAHALAHRIHGSPAKAALSQIPLAVLMVGYTVFGLWLLSAPTGG